MILSPYWVQVVIYWVQILHSVVEALVHYYFGLLLMKPSFWTIWFLLLLLFTWLRPWQIWLLFLQGRCPISPWAYFWAFGWILGSTLLSSKTQPIGKLYLPRSTLSLSHICFPDLFSLSLSLSYLHLLRLRHSNWRAIWCWWDEIYL